MPQSVFINRGNIDKRKYLKENKCSYIEVVSDTNQLFGTKMLPTAIYLLDKQSLSFDDKLNFAFSQIPEINSLFAFKNNWNIKRIRRDEVNISEDSFNNFINEKYNYNWYLVVNAANGSMNGSYFSGTIKNTPILSKDKVIDLFNKDNKVKKLIGSDNKEYLINLQAALKRPLLRYILYLSQEARSVIYEYIPDIDYTQIYSDEDILDKLGINTNILKIISNCEFEPGKYIEERTRNA